MTSCGAPDQSVAVDLPAGATLIQGKITKAGSPVAGAYVRLHDRTGEFTAEVISSPDGDFRFFAAPGEWELRALSSQGNTSGTLVAALGGNSATLTL